MSDLKIEFRDRPDEITKLVEENFAKAWTDEAREAAAEAIRGKIHDSKFSQHVKNALKYKHGINVSTKNIRDTIGDHDDYLFGNGTSAYEAAEHIHNHMFDDPDWAPGFG